MATNATALRLTGDLDLPTAVAERERLLALLDQPSPGAFEIEIVGERTTQTALQLLFATLREARERGLAVACGPRAAEEVARIAPRPN